MSSSENSFIRYFIILLVIYPHFKLKFKDHAGFPPFAFLAITSILDHLLCCLDKEVLREEIPEEERRKIHLNHIEDIFEKIYQQNFHKKTVNCDEFLVMEFNNIVNRSLQSNQKKSDCKLSKAERIIEDIFEEFWPDRIEDITLLEEILVRAELEFDQIFNLYWK